MFGCCARIACARDGNDLREPVPNPTSKWGLSSRHAPILLKTFGGQQIYVTAYTSFEVNDMMNDPSIDPCRLQITSRYGCTNTRSYNHHCPPTGRTENIVRRDCVLRCTYTHCSSHSASFVASTRLHTLLHTTKWRGSCWISNKPPSIQHTSTLARAQD